MSKRNTTIRTSGSWAAVAISISLFTLAAPGRAQKGKEAPIPPLPLSIAVVSEGDKPVRDAAWIDAQVAQANRLFGKHDVSFTKARSRPLPASFARLETRKDRDALAAELEKGVINVFVVASLRDVDDTSLFRQGVHWRPQASPSKHYAIVSMVAGETTLAHELGHFFGNGHTDVVDNLMSYKRTSVEATFIDETQGKKIRRFAGIYLRSKEILPGVVPSPGS